MVFVLFLPWVWLSFVRFRLLKGRCFVSRPVLRPGKAHCAFRLSSDARGALALLASYYEISQTEVLELLIREEFRQYNTGVMTHVYNQRLIAAKES